MCLYEFDQEKYMTEEREIAEEKGQARGEKIGQARGEKIGQARGERIGQAMGQTLKIISQVQKKLSKGLSPDEIAEALEEDVSQIREIYTLLRNYPDKTPEEILNILSSMADAVK